MTKPMKKLPQESWEKLFDEYYPELLTEGGEVRENVKEFIQQTLTSDRQRVVEEIEGMIGENERHYNHDKETFVASYEDNIVNEEKERIRNLIQQYKLQIRKEIEV